MWDAQFILGGELRDGDDEYYADYYAEDIREQVVPIEPGDEAVFEASKPGHKIINAFGIREDVHVILRRYGLFSEWIDGGTVGIYE
jgi:hypothetical protein